MPSMTDAQLLEAYVSRQDETAFAELMNRHGTVVYRACLRLLKDPHAAEDAAQAVFVVLARKAGSLRRGDLSAWLYRVAHWVAAKAVRTRVRRANRERAYAVNEAMQAAAPATEHRVDPALLGLMDEALLSLPERYREAVILRYLKNHSQEEAARLAGCPLGTMKRRASEGLDQLRHRLIQLGVATSTTALGGVLLAEAVAPVPSGLFASVLATVKSLAGTATATTAGSAKALTLAKGVLKTLFWAKVKTAAVAVVLTAGVVGSGLAATLALVHRPAAVPAPATTGRVWAWGQNRYGQLGNGTTKDSPNPVPVPGLDGVMAVAAGNWHTVALKADGTVVAWGLNDNGQLGDGTTTDRRMAGPVSGLSGIVAIAAKGFTLALKDDGRVFAWGYNADGQLGDGTTNNRAIPVQVVGLSEVTAIAAGQNYIVALKRDQTVWAWGRNDSGQLGDGTRGNNRLVPVQVRMADGSPIRQVIAIAAASKHTVALKSDGSVWAWGGNSNGQLGDGMPPNESLFPVPVKSANGSPLSGITAIAAGSLRTVALKADGTVWGWGQNKGGALGIGVRRSDELVPVQAKLPDGRPLNGITAIAAGLYYTLARKEDGTLWAWGQNSVGQLGDGTSGTGAERLYPVQVKKQDGIPLANVIAISANGQHSVAIVGE